MTPDLRDLLVITLVSGAPVSLVLVVAMLRGYTIALHMRKPDKRDRD